MELTLEKSCVRCVPNGMKLSPFLFRQ
jgi:hypothetical protein